MGGRGFFERLGERRMTREGAGLPAPEAGIRRYFYMLGTHFFKFVRLNLLFLLFSIPVVTLPASLTALDRVCIKLIRDGNCFLWADFIEEFRRSFAQSLPLGLLFGAGLAAAYYLVSLGISSLGSIYGIVFLAAGIFLLAFTLVRGSWVFAMLAMLKLKNRDILKNARILALSEGGRSAGILAALIAVTAFAFFLFPISLIPMALILFSLLQYTVCFLVNYAVQERIIAPYEKQRQEEKAYEGTSF